MALPGHTAGASLYATSKSYCGVRSRPASAAGRTVIAQQGPCDIGGGGGGGGGGGPVPRLCPPGQRCCEPAPNGGCFLCAPINAQCP
jgi:hypothetical protein